MAGEKFSKLRENKRHKRTVPLCFSPPVFQAAAALGYTQIVGRTRPFNTLIFSNGKNVITVDKTEHGVLNTERYQWKMATSAAKLDAGKYSTTDEYLNIIRTK